MALASCGAIDRSGGALLMAVRKTEPSDSDVDARVSSDAPMSVAPPAAAEPQALDHGRSTATFDSDARLWGFNLRLMRSGAALLTAFEIVYFILDSLHSSTADAGNYSAARWRRGLHRARAGAHDVPVVRAQLAAGLLCQPVSDLWPDVGVEPAHRRHHTAIYHFDVHTGRGRRAIAVAGSLAGGAAARSRC